MKTAHERRLSAIETQLRPPDAVKAERSLSDPQFTHVYLEYCEYRARRHLASLSGMPDSETHCIWYELSTEDHIALGFREWTDTNRLIEAVGPERAAELMRIEDASWAVLPWIGQIKDEASFRKQLAESRAYVDTRRAECHPWQQRWPEWRLGMSEEEHNAFELLLRHEREQRDGPIEQDPDAYSLEWNDERQARLDAAIAKKREWYDGWQELQTKRASSPPAPRPGIEAVTVTETVRDEVTAPTSPEDVALQRGLKRAERELAELRQRQAQMVNNPAQVAEEAHRRELSQAAERTRWRNSPERARMNHWARAEADRQHGLDDDEG